MGNLKLESKRFFKLLAKEAGFENFSDLVLVRQAKELLNDSSCELSRSDTD